MLTNDSDREPPILFTTIPKRRQVEAAAMPKRAADAHDVGAALAAVAVFLADDAVELAEARGSTRGTSPPGDFRSIGWGQDADHKRSQDAGFDHHLVKPLDIEMRKWRTPIDPVAAGIDPVAAGTSKSARPGPKNAQLSRLHAGRVDERPRVPAVSACRTRLSELALRVPTTVPEVHMARMARWLGTGLGLAALGYGARASVAWLQYGHPAPPTPADADEQLDRFMPKYDVAERHRIQVAAPVDVTMAAALETDLEQSAIIRGIIRTRALLLGARSDESARPSGLLAHMQSIGWGVLSNESGREVVVGAVTQPWLADVVFRAIAPDAFAAFDEPGYVKIVWTVRADPVDGSGSMFRTETRAVATDAIARRRFRWYWARFSPGIVVIRLLTLGLVKAEAERRAGDKGTLHAATRASGA